MSEKAAHIAASLVVPKRVSGGGGVLRNMCACFEAHSARAVAAACCTTAQLHTRTHAAAAQGDKYAVFHISDSSKTYLPAHLKPQHLKHYYEGRQPEHMEAHCAVVWHQCRVHAHVPHPLPPLPWHTQTWLQQTSWG